MKTEIYTNGPIACGVNANPLLDYTGGVVDLPNESQETDHAISVVGWGVENKERSGDVLLGNKEVFRISAEFRRERFLVHWTYYYVNHCDRS